MGSSDKRNWDLNFNGTLASMVAQVVERLATSPDKKLLEMWTEDCRLAFDQTFKDSETVLSNGMSYLQKFYGLMKSGKTMTYLANTIGGIVVHVEACVMSGLTDDEILGSDFMAIFGGDDSLNKFPKEFDHKKYYENVKLIVPVKECVITKSIIGAEFFSNTFVEYKNSIGAIPVRFTKHLINLRNNIDIDAGSAVCSLLREYCFDRDKFLFFEKLAFYYVQKGVLSLLDFKPRESYIYDRLGFEIKT